MRGHKYTAEQNDFIRKNSSSFISCVRLFNSKFKTDLSYASIKSHAYKIGVRTDLRPWTENMNNDLQDILAMFPYAEATEKFNALYGTNFSKKQIQDHCTHGGIKRGFAKTRGKIDQIIASNIEKPYKEIIPIIAEKTGVKYKDATTVCVRANNLGLHRQHRVWNNATDKRYINGKRVSFSEFVMFVGNRWHKLPNELHDTALLVVKLQATAKAKQKGGYYD